MPALVWSGRKWRTASDDFTFSSFFYAGLLTIAGALLLSRINSSAPSFLFGCDEEEHSLFGKSLLALACIDFGVALAFILTACCSLRGGIFETSKRRAVPILLYIDALSICGLLGLACECAKLAFYDGKLSLCSQASTRVAMRCALSLHFIITGLFVLMFLVAFDPNGRKEYHSVNDYAHAWWRRFDLFCCRCSRRKKAEDAYNDVAQVFAMAFRGYDMVPSDIAAGVLLLHGYQNRSRIILSSEVQYGPSPDGLPERVASQAQLALPLTNEQKGWTKELLHYSRFYIAAYGWMLFEFQHFGTGAARLCCGDPFMACRSHPGRHYNSGCFCNIAALLRETSIPEEDVLLASWENKMFCPVHYVAYDAMSDAIVVAIRGTMSLQDCITDLTAIPEELALRDGPPNIPPSAYYVHGGMLHSAKYVWKSLEYNGIFPLLLDGRFADKKVVVLGHSLGAGVAMVLAAMMWSDAPSIRGRLRCLAYAPPGGSLSAGVMEYEKSFTVGTFLGYDLVPRLSLHTFDLFRESLLDLLAASRMNKSVLFLNVLRTAEVVKSIHPSSVVEERGPQVEAPEECRRYRSKLLASPCVPKEPPKLLYNCANLIQFRKTVERCTAKVCPLWCAGYDDDIYIPVAVGPSAVQMILSSPVMFTDHMPEKLVRVMKRSVEQLDRGELDRFYTSDTAMRLSSTETAPMHVVSNTIPSYSPCISDYGSVV